MIAAVIFYSVLVFAIAMMIVERRIGRKPESERTERQKRFMAADLEAGRGLRAKYTDPRGVHIVSAVVGITFCVMGVVHWASGDVTTGIVGTIGGAVAAAFGIQYLVARSRRTKNDDVDSPD